MFMRVDKLQANLPAPERAGSQRRRRAARVARRQVRRDVDARELHVPELQLQVEVEAAPLLQPGRVDHRRGTRPRRARVGRRQHARQRPRRRRHRRRRRHFDDPVRGDDRDPRRGQLPVERRRRDADQLERPVVEQRLHHHHRQRRHRPVPQFPPRVRRAPPQAARVRDADRPDRPRGLRLPAGPRLGPRPRLCAGAREDHRRRHQEDAADAATSTSSQHPRVPEVPRRGLAPPPLHLEPRRL